MLRLITTLLATSTAAAFAPSTAFMAKTSSLTQPIAPVLAPTTTTSTGLCAMLTQTELPEKLYFPEAKETPKVLGGLKIGLRQLVVITGASSGLGLHCAATLAKTGKYFVVMACRDVEKGKQGMSVERSLERILL